jgi:putative hydrolase of the HAD superfamily
VTRIRGVLFDAAGTLIRLREPVGATYARFAAQHGVRLPASHVDDAFRRVFRGMPPLVAADADPAASRAAERAWWRELVRRTFRAADGSAVFRDFDALFDALFAHYADPSAWIAAPGAEACLRALREGGLRTGVVSNFDHRLGGLLAGLGLAPWIEVVVRPADAGAAKPDPRIFGLALARLGLAPEEALYVGDDADDDIAGATRAGLRAVDVATLASLADVPDAIVRCEEEPRP